MLPPFYQRYADLVTEKDLVAALEEQGRKTSALFRSIGEEKSTFRYAPGKWSIKQLVGHVGDCERVFAYRGMAFARGEKQPLPGFDENEYAAGANFDQQSMGDLIDGYEAIRRSTVLLFRSLSAVAWQRQGMASGVPLTVREIASIILGHERHHLNVLRERYKV